LVKPDASVAAHRPANNVNFRLFMTPSQVNCVVPFCPL
jgi:hypothetical protein